MQKSLFYHRPVWSFFLVWKLLNQLIFIFLCLRVITIFWDKGNINQIGNFNSKLKFKSQHVCVQSWLAAQGSTDSTGVNTNTVNILVFYWHIYSNCLGFYFIMWSLPFNLEVKTKVMSRIFCSPILRKNFWICCNQLDNNPPADWFLTLCWTLWLNYWAKTLMKLSSLGQRRN